MRYNSFIRKSLFKSLVKKNRKKNGFTLIELLVVMGIIAILAAIIIIALNPRRQFAQGRNIQRRSDIGAISTAVYKYALDNRRDIPFPSIDTNLRMIGTDTMGTCSVNCDIALSGGTTDGGVFHWKFDETSGNIAADSSGNGYHGALSGDYLSFVQNFNINAQMAYPRGLFFNPDGNKMYVAELGIGSNPSEVSEYNLSTSWDISTAVYSQNINVGAQDGYMHGLFFKSDGTKMYLLGMINLSVYEYDLSIPWDISTTSFLQAYSVSSEESQTRQLYFKSDGTKMYISGDANDDVYEYDLATAWDISTASFLQSYHIESTRIRGISFKSDGTRMYVVDDNRDTVQEYILLSPWDISTSTINGITNVHSEDSGPRGLFLKPDNSKMYVTTDNNGDTVTEYDMVPNNPPIWTYDAQIGGALYFDGIDDKVMLIDNSSFDGLITEGSISVWINANDINAGNQQIVHSESSSKFGLSIGNGGSVNVSTGSSFVNPGVVSNNTWYHLVGTWSKAGNLKTLYVNGVLYNSTGYSSSGNTDNIFIGSREGYLGDFFSGTIDDVRIFNRPLIGTEIMEIYDLSIGQTADSCIDLTAEIVPFYINAIPVDPLTGSVEKTHYGIRRTEDDTIKIVSCSAELGEAIDMTR